MAVATALLLLAVVPVPVFEFAAVVLEFPAILAVALLVEAVELLLSVALLVIFWPLLDEELFAVIDVAVLLLSAVTFAFN